MKLLKQRLSVMFQQIQCPAFTVLVQSFHKIRNLLLTAVAVLKILNNFLPCHIPLPFFLITKNLKNHLSFLHSYYMRAAL